MKKALLEVFKITDEKYDKYKNLMVDNVSLYKNEGKMIIDVSSDFFVLQKELEAIKKEIEMIYKNTVKVDINIKYQLEEGADKEVFIKDYFDWMKNGLKLKKPLLYAILENCEMKIEDNKIFVQVTEAQRDALTKNDFCIKIEKDLMNKFQFDTRVVFNILNNDDEINEKMEHLVMEESKKLNIASEPVVTEVAVKKKFVPNKLSEKLIVKETEDTLTVEMEHEDCENATENENTEEVKEEKKEIVVIMGSPIKEEPLLIPQLKGEDDKIVVIRGETFSFEDREVKNEKILATFFITDNASSITVKFFADKAKYPDIKDGIKKNPCLKVKGVYQFDTYSKEYIIMARSIEVAEPAPLRCDNYDGTKRVELHMHTKMSEMDAICSAEEIIKTAKRWGHKAIAITDHGNVQAFPEADHAKDDSIKILYGVEAYLVDDTEKVVQNEDKWDINGEYVVFDIETTGLSSTKNNITEIGAVKINNKVIIDRFSTFVNPGEPIPEKITELTKITDDMVKDADPIEVVLPKFLEFIGNDPVVAHNANFDTGFIRVNAERQKLKFAPIIIDTLNLSRLLYPELKKHKLDIVAEHLGVSLEGHHRAVNDAEATAEIYIKMLENLEKNKSVKDVIEINSALGTLNPKDLETNHCIIFAKNTKAMRYLYKIVSSAHVKYFKRFPRTAKSEVLHYRDHFIIGSACEAGELYKAIIRGKTDYQLKCIIDFYDYLEIQPISNNMFMIDDNHYENINSVEDIMNVNRKIVALGEKYNKPVVATSDAHFLEKEEDIVRKILLVGKGFSDGDRDSGLYLKTTEEMLEEMAYLGKEKAYEVTVTNSNLIADMMEISCPISKDKATPYFENCEEEFKNICDNTAHQMYGDNIPPIVNDRLKIERDAIINNGYTVLYMIAQKLVKKSNDDGYLVGSRGSVGSSFAATMSGITEVNPLPAHYVCPKCKFSDFDSDIVKQFSGMSGCDMPDKACPECGTNMEKWGHDIPFQTFLGFAADKEPDIDLNFSGDYQAKAHAYTEELFGKGHAYRAGTIGTLADKTAYGYVANYYKDKNMPLSRAEAQRIVNKAVGIKRTTGQHPGGIVVLPSDRDIYDFCPIQWPANNDTVALETTHYDYHSIDKNLLKLDILGHDDPTIIRMLEDLTGLDAKKIKLDDPGVMALFKDLSSLNIKPEDIDGCPVGTLGVPEFGTNFVIGMVIETKPQSFSDLVRISGLSHGTDVWLNNAQTLIQEGKAKISEVICTRDDIMIYLINRGMDKGLSFKIMESVRKGRGLTPEMEAAMIENGTLPDWYIPSCKKIKYMFPKAHAVAYVMMAWRIAYFKVYYPLEYYATFFSIRAKDFDYEIMCHGKKKLDDYIKMYKEKGNDATTKEKATLDDMKVVQEMYARGFEFNKINIYQSTAKKFRIIDGKITPSFMSIAGLGESVAIKIEEEAKKGEFFTIDDFVARTGANKTVVEMLKSHGILDGIPDSNQITLFDFA